MRVSDKAKESKREMIIKKGKDKTCVALILFRLKGYMKPFYQTSHLIPVCHIKKAMWGK